MIIDVLPCCKPLLETSADDAGVAPEFTLRQDSSSVYHDHWVSETSAWICLWSVSVLSAS
jgi:hypothetical protein